MYLIVEQVHCHTLYNTLQIFECVHEQAWYLNKYGLKGHISTVRCLKNLHTILLIQLSR